MKTKCSFLLLLVFVSVAKAQTINVTKADSVITDLYSKNQFNGVVLLANKGKVNYLKAFGYENYETKAALTTNAVFELASVSKQFTAMVIMMLKEKGKLAYDDLVEKYIDIPYKGITIRQLLTHTSGLPDYQEVMDAHWDKSKVANNKDIIAYLHQYHPPILFKPGEKYTYSNTGYVILASIAEVASGEDFIAFCQKHIFSKLKMKHTAIRTNEEKARTDHFALGHIWVPAREMYVRADSFPSSNYTIWLGNRKGPGRISSTATDLLAWDQALYHQKLIKSTTLAEAFTPMTLIDGSISNYGFGWEIIPQSTLGKIVWHNGDNPGYKTIISRYIDKEMTLIILCNNASASFENLTKSLMSCFEN